MFSLSYHRSSNTVDFWLYDDNGQIHDPAAWIDLLEGATTVAVEVATSSGGPWTTFVVNLDRWGAKKNLRANIASVVKNTTYYLRFRIDGGSLLGPVTVRWGT